MRRIRHIIPAFLALLGAFFWIWIIAPQLLQLPKNFQFSADIISIDNLYDEQRQQYAGDIYSKTKFSLNTLEESQGAIMVKNSFDVRTFDGAPIFSVERLYGIDRKTGMHVSHLADKPREGYLFAPRFLKKGQPFTYWHVNYDGPAHMQFVEETTLYGLPVYRYETHYEGVTIDQTANLKYLPGVGITRGITLDPYLQLWVEPQTGQLIKYVDNTVAYYYDLKTGARLHPWNHFQNTVAEESVQQNVESTYWKKTKASIVETYIPFLLFLFSIIALLKAFLSDERLGALFTKKNLLSFCGLLTIAVGIFSLTSWAVVALLHNAPHSITLLNPLKAVCFVLLGSSVIAMEAGQPRLTAACGVMLMICGSLRLLSFFELTTFQVDLLLFHHALLSEATPLRLSGFAAFTFTLLGIVGITAVLPSVKKLRLSVLLPTIVFLFSVFATLLHLFDAAKILPIPTFFSSPSTLATVLLLLNAVAFYGTFEKHDNNATVAIWLRTSMALFVSVLLTVIFTILAERSFSLQAQANFKEYTNRTVDAIQARMQIYINALQGGEGLFAASSSVERTEWKAYIDSLQIQKNFPGMQGMGYAVFVKPEDLEQHIRKIRSEGFPNYTVRPPGKRDLYSTIIYIEPFDERNKQAFGFDMFQEPNRRLAMEQARDLAEPRISARVTLVQEIDRDVQPGFLLYVPHYEQSITPSTTKERRASIVGYVYAPFRAHDFVESVIGNNVLADTIALRVMDGTETGHLLYDDSAKKAGSTEHPRFVKNTVLYIAGRPWVLTFLSTPDFGVTTASRLIPFFVLFVGILMSCLIALLYITIVFSREEAVKYAQKVTQDLRYSKAKDDATLRALNETALVSITDVKGNILFANDKFVEVSKYTREELIGQNHRILKSGHQPQELFANLWQAISKGKTWRGEIKNKAKDGSYYWVDTSIAPMLDPATKRVDKYIAIRFLITDKKEVELNLQKAFGELHKFQLSVERSYDAIVITDTNGTIQYVNPAFTKLTGYSAKEAIGQNPRILQSGKTSSGTYEAMWNAISVGKTFTSDELINKHKDGSEYYADIAIFPVMENDKPQFFVAMQRDVTQRKKEERAKAEFVSIASHQLRTPLTAIRWALGRFRKKVTNLEPTSGELLDAATAATKRMGETINAMLDISRIEAGKVGVEVNDVQLCDLLKEMRKEVEQLYTAKNIACTVSCADTCIMRSDPKLLEEIISNLLTNAIKYTPPGGKVSVDVKKGAKIVTISVSDTGYGIPRDQQEKIFTKFFRADNVLNKEPDGNGIGLYLVKELSELLGGSATFTSTLNKGTTFIITLPVTLE